MELYILIAVVVILLVWVIKTRNLFAELKNDVDTQQSNISNYRELRSTAINDAMQILDVAHSNDCDAIKQLNIEEQSKQLQAVGQMYPDLKNTPSYANALNRIQNYNEEIAASKNILNRSIQAYNKAIGMFPACIVASLFKYRRETFIDEANSAVNRTVNIQPVDYSKFKKS